MVVKSHGSATAAGVANAVAVAARLLEENLTERITADLAELGEDTARDRRGGRRIDPLVSKAPARRCRPVREQCRTRRDRRHQRRMDRRAHRHPQRHIAGEGETTAPLATEAARAALADADGTAEVDLIVLATATPDRPFPPPPRRFRPRSAAPALAFDVAAVCSGFLYALGTADAMLRTGMAKCALVIGAETFSRILDWEDRATCVLFGDGAGALVLRAEDVAEDGPGILATKLHADGAHRDLLFVDGGPSTTGTVGKLRMKGREVFRHAVINLADVLRKCSKRPGSSGRARLGRAAPGQSRSSMPPRASSACRPRVVVTVDRHANTSAASVPLAFDVARRDGRIKRATSSCWRRWAAASRGARACFAFNPAHSPWKIHSS